MAETEEPVTIKKYANRRLYNTGTSSYVTLEDLATMVKAGEDFVVFDAKTGEDITRSVLAQIIFEQENKEGQNLLPISFLRQLIRFYGDSHADAGAALSRSLDRVAHPRAGEVPPADGAGVRQRARSAPLKTRCGGTWRCSSAPSRCSRRSPSARPGDADAEKARARRRSRRRRRDRRSQAPDGRDAEAARPPERQQGRRGLEKVLVPAAI